MSFEIYQKEYYENNKENILLVDKQYREKNKEKLKEKHLEKFNCQCGGKYIYSNKSKHEKSLKHQAYLRTCSENTQYVADENNNIIIV